MQDYTKPPLTYTEQATLLKSRGLTINSLTVVENFLKQVNFYRFGSYCIPFQNSRDIFIPGTTFEKIVELYRLDEELRNSLMALFSPIEIYLRTHIVYELSHACSAYSHYEPGNFRGDFDHTKWLESLNKEIQRNTEPFLEDFKNNYAGFPRLPLWIACEVMSMGSLSFLYNGLLPDIQRLINSELEIHHYTLTNWMHVITYLRNLCAHHCRLWNRKLTIQPFIPNKDPRWIDLGLDSQRLFTSIAMAEWICHKAKISFCFVNNIHSIMRRISTLDSRFSTKMGIPADREIGMFWGVE
jgi:abortive infection bacteriophage resistance protein